MKMSFRYFNLKEFIGTITAEMQPRVGEGQHHLLLQHRRMALQRPRDKDRL